MMVLLAAIADFKDSNGEMQPGIKSIMELFGGVSMTPKQRERWGTNYNLINKEIDGINKFRQSKLVPYPQLFIDERNAFKVKHGTVLPEALAKITELEQLLESVPLDDIDRLAKVKEDLEWVTAHRWELGNDKEGVLKQVKSTGSFDFDEDDEVKLNEYDIHTKRWDNLKVIIDENPLVALPEDEIPEIIQYQKDVIQSLNEVEAYLNTEVEVNFVQCYWSDMPQNYSPMQYGIVNNDIILEIFLYPTERQKNKVVGESKTKGKKSSSSHLKNIN